MNIEYPLEFISNDGRTHLIKKEFPQPIYKIQRTHRNTYHLIQSSSVHEGFHHQMFTEDKETVNFNTGTQRYQYFLLSDVNEINDKVRRAYFQFSEYQMKLIQTMRMWTRIHRQSGRQPVEELFSLDVDPIFNVVI